MSSTPEDGEVEQHAVEEEEPYIADFPNETEPAQDQSRALNEIELDLNDDVDTIPQLDPPNEDGPPVKESHGAADQLVSSSQPVILDTQAASVDDSASIPDDAPSVQNSGLSSPRGEPQLLQPPISRKSSTASRRPFELRFQSRLSSSYLHSPRASSPAFLNSHSRHSSLASFGQGSDSVAEEAQAPWEVIRWTRLKRLTGQAFSEVGRRNFGNPTCLAVSDQIVVGTSKGLVLVFDHHQNSKAVIGSGTKAAEAGAVTALAISADHTAIAAGHANGDIFTWETSRSSRPFMQIPAIDVSTAEARKYDGHVQGSAVAHIGFLGYRRTALVSADDKGMAFSHLASRGTGSLGRTIKTTRILGRYPELITRKNVKPVKKSSVLAFAPLPLGNIEQNTDPLGLVAMLTPYLLVIVSTTPIAQTQHKLPRPKEVVAHSTMTAALAWFPSIKLKGSSDAISKNKLVYVWSNVVSVLEIEELPRDPDAPEEKPVDLQFVTRSRYKAGEAIVAVQWLSRSVIAALTITQQLLVIEDVTMNVTDAFDLLPKNLYHADLYSHQLESVIEQLDEGDTSLHGVVADAYYMSFRCHKGRLFLLGFSDMWWGSLTNWADRLLAMMETSDFIGAIRLATKYFSGSGEKVTIGLPEDDALRSALVRDKLLEMMSASLRYVFAKTEQVDARHANRQQTVDLAVACVAACLKMNEQQFLFDEVFEWYDDNDAGDIFVDVLEPHILDRQISTLPPAAVKVMINHFSQTHAPSQLEEIICLLDATAMDVDQVTTLCKEYNLYDAYIYVWNTALLDYASPLQELLKMASEKTSINGHSANSSTLHPSEKMFPYLSFVLTGRIYPIGEFMEDDRALSAKLQLYELLFYGRGAQADPFSILRSILKFDTPNFFAALNEAFEDTFLNNEQEENSDEITNNQRKIAKSSAFNRQIIVRILLDVMSSGFDVHEHIYLDMFIARNLPKYPQYMLLAGTTMEQVLTRLCENQDHELHEEVQLSIEYLMTVFRPANITTYIPLLKRARFYRILKAVYRQEKDWVELLKLFFVDSEDRQRVFDLILEVLRPMSEVDMEEKQAFSGILREHAEDLAKINVQRVAVVIDTVSPNEHQSFLESFSDTRLQYSYLRSLLAPDDGSSPSSNSISAMLEHYIRLLCQYDPNSVVTYINTVKEGNIQLEKVIPTLETSGNIDATVVLLARQGQVRDAMDRLVKHLTAVEAALMGVLESAADSPDEVATNEAIEDLLSSVDKYAKVGIWLCENQTRQIPDKKATPSKSPKRSSAKQPLAFEEELWLELIVAIVGLAQKIGPGTYDEKSESDELALTLRNTIHRVFTALLNSTAIVRGQAQFDSLRFVRILRAFLSRAAEISPSISHLRHVMSSVFSAYTYEESLLSLSNAILDKDLFVQVDEVTKLRQLGWRPRGQVCGICRRRVWGPGSGLKVWEAWEKKEKDRNRRSQQHRRLSVANTEITEEEARSKGKAAASHNADEDDDDAEEHISKTTTSGPSSAIVFACRHIYHRTCLDQSQSIVGEDDNTAAVAINDGNGVDQSQRTRLICPSCI